MEMKSIGNRSAANSALSIASDRASIRGSAVESTVAISLYQEINFGGWNHDYSDDMSQLPSDVTAQAASLRVLRPGWTVFYSDSNYGGSELYVFGPFEIPDLRTVTRHVGPRWLPIFDGNWSHDISSFKLLKSRPSGDGTYINDPASQDSRSSSELLTFIESMPHLNVQQDGTSILSQQHQTTADGMSDIATTSMQTTMSVTELAAFNPNIAVIWPGALIEGSSLSTGILAPVNVQRAPLTVLLSTLGVPEGNRSTPQTFKTVFTPSAASVDALRLTLLQDGFVVPAKLSQVFKQFYSLDHAMMQIGASASYLGSSIRAQLDTESFESQSNVIVEFSQEYYTIAAEAPSSPISYFDTSVSKATLQPYADTSGNPLTYVESVTYGRLGLLLASSSQSYDKVHDSIVAAVQFALGGANANFDQDKQRIVNQSDVKLLLLGGTPDSALTLIPSTKEALDAMSAWLNQPITSKPKDIQLGLPISYRVNYLKDNQVALLSFTTTYDKTQITAIPQLSAWTITFYTANDDKDDNTALRVEVLLGSTVIAQHSENGETFDNGSTKTRQLDQVHVIFAKDAAAVRLHVHIDPNGNDTWDFGFTLTATNTAGSNGYVKSGHMTLSQDNRDGYA